MNEQTDREFWLQRVYIKDLTFESPRTPEIFQADTDGKVDLNISMETSDIDPQTVEVVLTIRLRTFVEDQTIFVVELDQAGLFRIGGFTPEERFELLATECPLLLQSYARVAISDAVNRGGFPDMLIQPVDFHTLYVQKALEAAATQAS